MNAMAAREHEEEQTQRTMLALNALRPSYPGKNGDDVKLILEKVHKKLNKFYCTYAALQIHSDWPSHRSKVGSFWLLALDSAKRKQVIKKHIIDEYIVTCSSHSYSIR